MEADGCLMEVLCIYFPKGPTKISVGILGDFNEALPRYIFHRPKVN
jgi:hypothetical protein